MFYDIIISQANQVHNEIPEINQKVQNVESVIIFKSILFKWNSI